MASTDAGTTSVDAGPPQNVGCLDILEDSTISLEVEESIETRVDLTFNGLPPPATNGRYPPFLEARHETWGGLSVTAYAVGEPSYVDGTIEVIPGPHRFQLKGGGCGIDDGTPYCFDRDGSLDIGSAPVALDVSTGPVDFTLTLNGGLLPDRDGVSMNRGTISLLPLDPDVSWPSRLRLPNTGAVRVQVAAFVGSYDVVYSSGLCGLGGPCGDGIIGRIDVEQNSTARTLDLRPVTVSGRLTHNGATANDWSGYVTFRLPAETRGSFVGARAEITADGTYETQLLPGLYDVGVERIGGAAPPAPPIGTVALRRGEFISTSTLLDLDVASAVLDLGMTLNGGAIPITGEGLLTLQNEDDDVVLSVPLFELTGRWQRSVAAGRYSMHFQTFECRDDGLPCITHEIVPAIDLSTDQRIDVDLTPYTVGVTLTANGEAFGEDGGARGLLSFSTEDGHGWVQREVPLSGAARVAVTLPVGRYHVSYGGTDGHSTGCVCAALVPCGAVSLGTIEVTGDLESTLDVTSVAVSGDVAIDGTPLTFLYDEMATLTLNGIRIPIGADGRFEARVAPGSHAVDYRPACFGGEEVPRPRACVGQTLYRCDDR